MNLGPVMKAVNNGIVGLLAAFALVYSDKKIDLQDVLSLIITAAVAAGVVFGVRNTARFRAAKMGVGLVAVGVGVVLSGLQDGKNLDVLLILGAVSAVISAITVYNTSNAEASNADSTASVA